MKDKLRNIYRFYLDGFREMTIGKTLWAVIIVKLAIIFLVLKLLFFPSKLSEYDSDAEKAQAVRTSIIK